MLFPNFYVSSLSLKSGIFPAFFFRHFYGTYPHEFIALRELKTDSTDISSHIHNDWLLPLLRAKDK
jgi:hypothetical protein